jgi:hypothetical protein
VRKSIPLTIAPSRSRLLLKKSEIKRKNSLFNAQKDRFCSSLKSNRVKEVKKNETFPNVRVQKEGRLLCIKTSVPIW